MPRACQVPCDRAHRGTGGRTARRSSLTDVRAGGIVISLATISSPYAEVALVRRARACAVALLGRRASSSAGKGVKRPMRHTRIVVTHYGGPDALRVVEEECPEPKDGEVRVRVLAAGVCLPDVMAREGVHPETPPVPFTPGWDLVGVVD